jgi:hypothetical protein
VSLRAARVKGNVSDFVETLDRYARL